MVEKTAEEPESAEQTGAEEQDEKKSENGSGSVKSAKGEA